MKKGIVFLLLFFKSNIVEAQVGINTTIPNAQLDIRSSNQASPSNTDGILIPKVNVFPAINPTAAQQGMLVYLTTTSGTDSPGFYYWDNATIDWKPITGTSIGTLDQAYDFGGAGSGRTIVANAGAVTINGTDGLLSTGTFGSGALVPSGFNSNPVFYWNPRRSAFRACRPGALFNSDGFTGDYSVGFGADVIASGEYSFSAGLSAYARGDFSVAFGNTNASESYGETVLGIGATTYSTSLNGSTQFRTANAIDRLFVIGNAIDANNNNIVDAAERSNAMVVLKNGNVGFGTSFPQTKLHVLGNLRMVDGNQAAGRVLTSDANGTATWQNATANTWGLIGNTGINDAINFIGTTNNADLVFKRNNINAGRINFSDSNTSFGINTLQANNTGFNNSAYGHQAMLSNIDGANNTAFGRTSLYSNSSGWGNSAFGTSGLTLNTTGNNNSAIGTNAMPYNTSGNDNSAFGVFSLLSTTGSGNTALGSFSLYNNSTGNYNTGVGFDAGVLTGNLTNATAVGAFSAVSASNTLVLGSINGVNGATSNVKVGIGTTTPVGDLELRQPNPVLRIAADDTNSSFLQLYEMSAGLPFGYMFEYDGNNDKLYLYSKGFAGNDGIRMTWLKTGNVGIGTFTPNGQFELSLNEGRKPGTNTWTIVSDKRLKTINGTYTKGLNEILQLNPIRFNYKNNGERTFEQKVLDTEFPGFIAQEVQPLFPDAVGTDADGFLNFNIHPILIASVNAIKELNEKNQILLEENIQLKLQVESLSTQQKNQELFNKAIGERLAALESKN